MMMTKERAILKAKEKFQDLLVLVEAASDEQLRIDEVERSLFAELLALGLQLLSAFVAAAGKGDEGTKVKHNGKTLKRMPKSDKRYVSIFGELAIDRYVYAARKGSKIEYRPLDAQLGLPEAEISYVLEDWLNRLSVKEAFEEGCASLETLLGLKIGVHTAERLNQRLAAYAESFRDGQASPVEEDEAILVVTADGKGVPMQREKPQRSAESVAETKPKSKSESKSSSESESKSSSESQSQSQSKSDPSSASDTSDADAGKPRRRRRGKGEKANPKRMAYVGAVYSIAPFERTTNDVMDEVARRESAARRPRPCGKRVWAELNEPPDQPADAESGHGREKLFARLAVEAQQRNRLRKKPLVCLMDGEAKLWKMQAKWLPRAIGVLDFWHVSERMWTVAHVFHAEESPEAEAFVERRLRMLLDGKVGYVLRDLRRLRKTRKLTKAKRDVLDSAITYFENNQQHMRYGEYLAAGYPIGSGVIEGACRHLINDRMEQAGMKWRPRGAQAMLRTRSLYLNGDWDAFLSHRINTEQHCLYSKAA